jgi:hypothetical protein
MQEYHPATLPFLPSPSWIEDENYSLAGQRK